MLKVKERSLQHMQPSKKLVVFRNLFLIGHVGLTCQNVVELVPSN